MLMIRRVLVLLLGLAISSMAIGKEAKNLPAIELAALMASYPVTILGEKHRRPKSTQLTADLVDKLTDNGSCLAVALEIPSDQQPILEAALQGDKPVSAVYVAPMIDHPAFRTLLEDLRDQMLAGRCLTVSAVDTPSDALAGRDEWMSDHIERLAADHRVLALMGNLHTIKQTRWVSGIDDPFLAEHLERRGLRVLSVMQGWDEGCEERTGRWLPINHSRAIATVRGTLSLAAIRQPEAVDAVADGAVIWECAPQ